MVEKTLTLYYKNGTSCQHTSDRPEAESMGVKTDVKELSPLKRALIAVKDMRARLERIEHFP